MINCIAGYLSSRLALEYKLRVLGIDANSSNTENALKRNSKLEVIFNSTMIVKTIIIINY